MNQPSRLIFDCWLVWPMSWRTSSLVGGYVSPIFLIGRLARYCLIGEVILANREYLNRESFHRDPANRAIARWDQLWGAYRPDHWIRNRKLRWAIWNWILGAHRTNAHIVYVNLHEKEGKRKTDLPSHHDFCKSIALSWINLEAVRCSKVISLSRKTGGDT